MTQSSIGIADIGTTGHEELIRAREIVAEVAWASPADYPASVTAQARIRRGFLSGDNDSNIGVRVARNLLATISTLQSRLDQANEALRMIQTQAAWGYSPKVEAQMRDS